MDGMIWKDAGGGEEAGGMDCECSGWFTAQRC